MNRQRSFSESRRPSFHGCITAGAVFISDKKFTEVCQKFNNSPKNNLAHDKPELLCSLTFSEIKKFPDEAETNLVFKDFISNEMKNEAKKNTGDVKYGLDFIYRHCIMAKTFDHINENFHFLCQIAVPKQDRKYRKIDLTGLSGKTDRYFDKNIMQTLIRETREELGLNLSEYLPSGKLGILHPGYQLKQRKRHNCIKLPYDFMIGEYGSQARIFVLMVDEKDLLNNSILEEEKEIEKINAMLQITYLRDSYFAHYNNIPPLLCDGWNSGDEVEG